MSFEWKRLCVRYKSEKGEKVSGPQSASCAAGSVNAILANDSNLAEALLQTMAYSQSDLGELLLNGHPRPRDWKYRFAFVPNTDTLSGKLTVEEHLKLAVSQRCWQGTTSARRKEIVNELIAYFELEELMVYNCDLVAIKTCHHVNVVFLFDPLNGLDADSISFLSTIERLSRDRNIPIIVALTKVEPEYFEYIAGVSVIFEKTAITSCSKDTFIDAVDSQFQGSSIERKLETFSELLYGAYTSRSAMEKKYANFSNFTNLPGPPHAPVRPLDPVMERWPAPWYVTFWNLLLFQLYEDFRSRKYVLGLLLVNFTVYMIMSFVFFQLPLTSNGLVDRVGLLYFLNINVLFSNSLSRMVRFEHALRHFALDRRVRLIQSAAFVWSQFVASLPLRSLSLLVFGTALYYITGLRTDGFQYVVVFISDLLLLICASVALGMLVQVSVHRLEYGQIVMPFLVVVSFIFGNLSTAPNPTWILRWIQFISPVFYSFQCLIQNELAGASAADDTDLAAYLDLNEFDEIPIAACLPALAGFAILYLVLTTIIYHYRYPKMKLL